MSEDKRPKITIAWGSDRDWETTTGISDEQTTIDVLINSFLDSKNSVLVPTSKELPSQSNFLTTHLPTDHSTKYCLLTQIGIVVVVVVVGGIVVVVVVV